MRYDSSRDNRRSIRLRGYDYATSGAYYITICTRNRERTFGDVLDGDVVLSGSGRIVSEEWERSASIRPGLTLDSFVVMPNHLHGIVSIDSPASPDVPGVGAHSCAPLRTDRTDARLYRLRRSLASFVGQFKASTTRRIDVLRATPGAPVWQRNYYEHIVRDEDDLERIRSYIADNPRRWVEDEYYTQ